MKQKLIGMFHIVLCIGITLNLQPLFITDPIAKETASLIQTDNLITSSFLSAYLVSSLISLAVTFILAWIIFNWADAENGMKSNIISLIQCHIAILTYFIVIIAAIVFKTHEILNQVWEIIKV